MVGVAVEDMFEAGWARPTLASRHLSAVERVMTVQRTSAALLRRAGHHAAARRADAAALRAQLTCEEPGVIARMFDLVRLVRERAENGPVGLAQALYGMMSLLRADMGNIQRPAVDGGLRIVSHSGFAAEFLAHFARVDDASSACGRAAGNGSQVVIVDVAHDPSFAPHRAVAKVSGFRAVQSTPLVDQDDRLLAVVSTHFREPHEPSSRDLLVASWYVEAIRDVLQPPVRAFS